MKRAFVIVYGLVLFLSVFVIGGCKEENSVQITAPTGLALYVYPHECLLSYEPDTASAWITVAVRDHDNQPLPGATITISLADSQAGGIRFLNDSLRNTTNERGEVYLWYLGYQWGAEYNTVTASFQGVSDSCRVTLGMRTDDPYTLEVSVNPDTLHVPAGGADSAWVEVQLRDPYSSPVEHYRIYLSTNGGSLGFLGPTDAQGRAITWWRTDDSYGTYHIVAYGRELIDTAWVCVQPELEL